MKYGPLFGICDKHTTPEALMENIREFETQGAHGVVIDLDGLKEEFFTAESIKKILSACCRVESYVCCYRSTATAHISDEKRAEILLMAADNGASIVDVMGDIFDKQEGELTFNEEAVEKQKRLIGELREKGATVLMSSHVSKPCSVDETLKYFHTHYERGVNISKAVFHCNTEEEYMISREISETLSTTLPIPFVFVCSGDYGKKYQRYETLLNGSLMTFVRCTEGNVQPTVKQALDFMRRRTPWASAAGKMENGEFINRTAVITGAGSGMGLLAAKLFAAKGASVVLVDINKDAIDAAVENICANGGKAMGITADVRSYADAEKTAAAALEKYKSIDYLLCFAGGYEPRCCKSFHPFYEQPIEVIDWGLDVNLRGPVYFARACMPAMVKQKHGVIVCLGSVSGVQASPDGPMYGTSKSGLFQFVKCLALAGAPHNVRAVCVAPGPVLTRPDMANMPTPLKRAAEPVEIVDFIMNLCSDRSSFVTGSTHFIDGGYLCNFGR
ncbi:MAG: type I 3-dehydroquinate dehydratase [Lentisphaeria bacterium]|nr:type I 3-dehydroquinate dehydratase [Lentisphaeria bacterium]